MNDLSHLGSLEQSIMDIMWQEKCCHIRNVYTKLNKDRKIAYTTVMTVMVRLVKKGLLNRKKDGNSFVYSCSCSKKNFAKKYFAKALNGLIHTFEADAVAAFADEINKLPDCKRKELIDLLQKKS